MHTIYLSLGSNLGDRKKNIDDAITELSKNGIRIQKISPTYETEPVGFADQNYFYNLALEAQTEYSPVELLVIIQKIEREMGRVRAVPNGPRVIDIDILLYDNLATKTNELTLPHPRMSERKFVLAPLADITPDLIHPTLKETIARMLANCSDQHIVKKL